MKKIFKSLVSIMLITIMALSFTSCGVPKDSAKAEENLKSASYTLDPGVAETVIKTYATANWGISSWSKITDVVYGFTDSDSVLIVYCNDKDLLKNIYEDLEAVFEKIKSENKDANVKKGKSGACAWIGTADGIKSAK